MLKVIDRMSWQRDYDRGLKAFQRGEFPDAVKHWSSALKKAEELGEVNRLTKTLNELGTAHHLLEEYEVAERLHERGLAIREERLGPDHYDVAQSLSNLGLVYSAQKRNTDAEVAYKRALMVLEKTIGSEHPEFAFTLVNLALLYQTQEKYVAAEECCGRAVAILENQLGPGHPQTVQVVSLRADLLQNLPRSEEE